MNDEGENIDTGCNFLFFQEPSDLVALLKPSSVAAAYWNDFSPVDGSTVDR